MRALLRLALEFERLRIVLVRTRNPLNIGAAARAMSNFGFAHLRVVNPYEPSFHEARSAVGGSAVLAHAEEFSGVAEAVADCTLVVGTSSVGPRMLQQPVRELADGARLIRRQLRSGGVALLFGSEKVGLSNRDLANCHWVLRIPTREAHRSMNLGQAVAVCLYELARLPLPASPPAKDKLATTAELDRLSGVLLEALRLSGYVKPGSAAPTEENLLRLVRRLQLSPIDAEVLLGMLRQILWKLSS